MTSTFGSRDASALGAFVQSSVDPHAFGESAGGIIVEGAAAQFYGALQTFPDGTWTISASIIVWGLTRVTDLRGSIVVPGVGSYSWAGLPLDSDTASATVWSEVTADLSRSVTRTKNSPQAGLSDTWTFAAQALGLTPPAAPAWPTTDSDRVFEAAIRSVSATPSDNSFRATHQGDTVSTAGTVDVPTTAAAFVADLQASALAGIAKFDWTNPALPVFIDPGDGIIHATVSPGTVFGEITISVTGFGSGTVEGTPVSSRFYDVTRTVLWSP